MNFFPQAVCLQNDFFFPFSISLGDKTVKLWLARAIFEQQANGKITVRVPDNFTHWSWFPSHLPDVPEWGWDVCHVCDLPHCADLVVLCTPKPRREKVNCFAGLLRETRQMTSYGLNCVPQICMWKP